MNKKKTNKKKEPERNKYANMTPEDRKGTPISNMKSEDFRQLIGQILYENGFIPSIYVEKQDIDGNMTTVTMRVIVDFNGRLDPKTVPTGTDLYPLDKH